MPKKILSLVLFFLLVVTVYFQASSVGTVSAAPITGPVTSPVTFFNLTGKVVYKQLGKLLNNAKRVIPAEDVMIKVYSFFGGNLVGSASTDENGMYQLQLPNGMYRVEASGGHASFYVPPLRVVNLKANKVKQADFQGLLFSNF